MNLNITTLSPDIAQYAKLITKSSWNRLSKNILVQEALFQNLSISQVNKKIIIQILMTYYRQYNLTKFTFEVAEVIQQRSLRKPFLTRQITEVISLLSPLQPITTPLQVQKEKRVGELYTLEEIYDLNKDTLHTYRTLMNNPNVGLTFSKKFLIYSIVKVAHKRNLLSDDDQQIHNNKSFKMIKDIDSINNINKLLILYGLKIKGSFLIKALKLYRKGVGYYDILFAISNEPNLMTGNLGYVPKKDEVIGNGVYDRSGKVNKNEKDFIDIILGNPYSYLTGAQLRYITNERDILVGKRKHQIVFVIILTNYDNVSREWVDHITETPINDLIQPEIYYRLGALGINLTGVNMRQLSMNNLREMLRIGEIIMRKNPIVQPRKNLQKLTFSQELSFVVSYNGAVKNGIELTKDNIGFTFKVFGVRKNITETVKYFKELAQYPPNITAEQYESLTKAYPKTLRLILENKYSNDVNFLDHSQLLFIASRDYSLPIPNISNIKKRYEELKGYKHSLIIKILSLYRTGRNLNFTNYDFYLIARSKLNPLETIIVSYYTNVRENNKLTDKESFKLSEQYGARVGMIIPPSVNNKVGYFLSQITQYKYIMSRPVDIKPIDTDLLSVELLTDADVRLLLRNYTDQEIFMYTGAYLPYNDRSEIINNVNAVRSNSTFFVPTVRNCENTETVGLEETNDPTVFIVAYGTLFNYYCYDIGDFEDNFKEHPIAGMENMTVYRFRKPDTFREDFTTDEIKFLIRLLTLYPTVPRVEKLIKNMIIGLGKVREITNYDKDVLILFRQLYDPDKSIIREWLMQLFYTGMYMRRWNGPPEDYPVSKKSTRNRPDPNVKVNEEMQVLGYYPLLKTETKKPVSGITGKLTKEGQTFVDNIRSVEYDYDGGDIRVSNQETTTIGYYLNRVRRGKMCIRMASSIFIGTASYYLYLFYLEEIPRFDPITVATIV